MSDLTIQYLLFFRFIKKTGACIDDIGFTKFIEKVKTFMKTTGKSNVLSIFF